MEALLQDNTSLLSLSLQHNTIGAGAQRFIPVLAQNESLIILNMENNEINDEELQSLCEALQSNRTLTSVNLSHNDISEASALALRVTLRENSVLNSLNLSSNPLKNSSAIGGLSVVCRIWGVLSIAHCIVRCDQLLLRLW